MKALSDERSEPPESFPDPVAPSPQTAVARRRRLSELTQITLAGIGFRIGIILAEFLGVALSGSAVLLVDAIASLYDCAASLVLLAAIRFAARPPDEDHPFGHGRVEPLAGFQMGLLLGGAGIWLTIQNAFTLIQGDVTSRIPGWLWIIPGCATLVLLGIAWRIHRVGTQAGSAALRAESMHFQIDAWTSLLTTITLAVAAMSPSWSGWLDRGGGMLLALLMVGLGIQAARENLHQLLDRIPRDEEFARVRAAALSVNGVFDIEKIRIQHAGPDAHVDIDIEVDPQISVAESHLIAQHVRARIQTDWPFVREVVVHVEPFYAGDH